jgi:hypothetical protein
LADFTNLPWLLTTKITLYFSFKPIHSQPTWEKVHQKYNNAAEFANVMDLVDLLMTIPAHSADCERGFSRMKNIKTKLRNKLEPGSLTAIMRIQLHSLAIDEFDPMPAIELWNNSSYRERRPFQAPYGPRKKRLNPRIAQTDDSSNDSDDPLPDSDQDSEAESDNPLRLILPESDSDSNVVMTDD